MPGWRNWQTLGTFKNLGGGRSPAIKAEHTERIRRFPAARSAVFSAHGSHTGGIGEGAGNGHNEPGPRFPNAMKAWQLRRPKPKPGTMQDKFVLDRRPTAVGQSPRFPRRGVHAPRDRRRRPAGRIDPRLGAGLLSAERPWTPRRRRRDGTELRRAAHTAGRAGVGAGERRRTGAVESDRLLKEI